MMLKRSVKHPSSEMGPIGRGLSSLSLQTEYSEGVPGFGSSGTIAVMEMVTAREAARHFVYFFKLCKIFIWICPPVFDFFIPGQGCPV